MLLFSKFTICVSITYFLEIIIREKIAYGSTLNIPNNVILNSIIKPFSNCITVIYVFKAIQPLLTETTPPIVLFNKESLKKEFLDSKILQRCSFIQRRNPSKHCRALFIVQPETNEEFTTLWHGTGTSLDEIYQKLTNFHASLQTYFNPPRYGPQYTIWITKIKKEIFQNILEVLSVHKTYAKQDLLMVEIDLPENLQWNTQNLLICSLYYFNRYYENKAKVWFPIRCNLEDKPDCFHQIELVVVSFSLLNKYFGLAYRSIFPQRIRSYIIWYTITMGNS